MEDASRRGPLTGLRVVEFASLGPGPHCAMLLSDLGAEVLRIDRPGGSGRHHPVLERGRSKVLIDLRQPEGRDKALAITDEADVLIEGLRPGVMERLGLGPDVACARNPRLVYGRMTGWGQTGPRADTAGHDINYVGLTGALAAMGSEGSPPPPPLNLVGDFGGGSLYLAFGIMAALWERERSGLGQVIDAAIVDGVVSLMAMFSGMIANGGAEIDRDRSLLSGAAPFYRCYECADGRFVSVGAIEPQFYQSLLDGLDADDPLKQRRFEPENWAERAAIFAAIFLRKSRDAWCAQFAGTDACVTPVLAFDEAPADPHLAARGSYFEVDGVIHGAPAPRFSRTPGGVAGEEPAAALLARWSVTL